MIFWMWKNAERNDLGFNCRVYETCARRGGIVYIPARCGSICEPQIDFRLSGRGLLARSFVQGDTFPEIQSRRRTCGLENGRSANSTCAHTWLSSFAPRTRASSLLAHSAYTFGTSVNHSCLILYVKILERPKSFEKVYASNLKLLKDHYILKKLKEKLNIENIFRKARVINKNLAKEFPFFFIKITAQIYGPICNCVSSLLEEQLKNFKLQPFIYIPIALKIFYRKERFTLGSLEIQKFKKRSTNDSYAI